MVYTQFSLELKVLLAEWLQQMPPIRVLLRTFVACLALFLSLVFSVSIFTDNYQQKALLKAN